MATINIERESWKSLQADGQYGRVFIITDTVYMDPDTGDVLKRKRHRRPIEPRDDISSEPLPIRRICEAIRTDDALARYDALQAE